MTKQGQPQQEPAKTPWDELALHRRDDHMWCVWCTKYEKAAQAAQERQAGGHHVHRLVPDPTGNGAATCPDCATWFDRRWVEGYREGVADAAARGR